MFSHNITFNLLNIKCLYTNYINNNIYILIFRTNLAQLAVNMEF